MLCSGHVSHREQALIKRILLVRTDRLGDVILTLPMLPVLRSCFPDAHIAMLLRRYTGAIIEGNPFVNELIWYDEGAELVSFSTMRRALRQGRFDAVIVVYPTFRLAWLMFSSGIPVRIGTGYRSYSFLFNRRVYEHRKDARRHEVEYNLSLLSELGCTASGPPEFSITLPGGLREKVREILKGSGIDPSREIIVLHPGSGGSAREWSGKNFGALAARLGSDPAVQIVVTATGAEAGKAEEVVRDSNGKARSLTGMLTLQELAVLIEMSRLFISNSTGPIHVAAALGTPVVGLYPWQTAMSAHRWGPYTDRKIVLTPQTPGDCSDCEGSSVCACMESISVEDTYRAARSLLDRYRIPVARSSNV